MNSTTTIPTIAFDRDDAIVAVRAWNCNCGPSALAAALGKRLDDVRPAVEAAGFAEKGYMSPTMMRRAVPLAGGRLHWERQIRPETGQLMFPEIGIARIQWTGPWTAPGANPKWAYRQTHWVASWRSSTDCFVFDINGGILPYADWVTEVVPLIVESMKRADGGWFVTHSWELAT